MKIAMTASELLNKVKDQTAGPKMVGRSNAVRTQAEHGVYDSKHEATQVEQLFELQMRGQIYNLERQKPYDLVVNDVIIGRYRADASFKTRQEITLRTLDGPRVFEADKTVVIDAKGHKTEVYKIKKKLMLALHAIEIIEV